MQYPQLYFAIAWLVSCFIALVPYLVYVAFNSYAMHRRHISIPQYHHNNKKAFKIYLRICLISGIGLAIWYHFYHL